MCYGMMKDGIGEQPCAIEERRKSTGFSMLQKYKMHCYVRNCAEVHFDFDEELKKILLEMKLCNENIYRYGD